MTQPTQTDQALLKYAIDGAPSLAYYQGTPNTTLTLKFSLNGIPVYSPGSAAAAGSATPYVFFMT